MGNDGPSILSDRRAQWGLASSALLLLGSVTPWATAGPFTKNGLDGDGVITLVIALLVGGLIVARRFPRIALGLAVVSLAITIIDTVDVSGVGGGLFDVQVGWGLILALLASASLVAWGVVGLRQRSPAPASSDAAA